MKTVDQATAEQSLTPKQKQVLAEARKGKTTDEVARVLKISRQGVYGHMRKIRKAGVALPSGLRKAAPPSATPTNGNVHASVVGDDVRRFLADALNEAEGHVVATKEQLDLVRADAEELAQVYVAQEAHEKKLRSALAALN